MELIIQRLKSKTYLVALLGTVVTIVEANVNLLGSLLPAAYTPYLVMAWPALMLTLREVTHTSLADK